MNNYKCIDFIAASVLPIDRELSPGFFRFYPEGKEALYQITEYSQEDNDHCLGYGRIEVPGFHEELDQQIVQQKADAGQYCIPE